MKILPLFGAVTLVAVLAACSGTMQGASNDMGITKKPAPVVQQQQARPAVQQQPYDDAHHPLISSETTLEQDREARDRADLRAEQQAERNKQARHAAFERQQQIKNDRLTKVNQTRVEQADRDAVIAQRKVDEAQLALDRANTQKVVVEDRRKVIATDDPVVTTTTTTVPVEK